jgi:hypothetical protein
MKKPRNIRNKKYRSKTAGIEGLAVRPDAWFFHGRRASAGGLEEWNCFKTCRNDSGMASCYSTSDPTMSILPLYRKRRQVATIDRKVPASYPM